MRFSHLSEAPNHKDNCWKKEGFIRRISLSSNSFLPFRFLPCACGSIVRKQKIPEDARKLDFINYLS
ncbi:Protein of unknown function [Gryllus bimaculatus]|nr:Protein of unknown function [Gryllus bimaculatus]